MPLKARDIGNYRTPLLYYYTVFQKSDAKIQKAITTVYLIRIEYAFSGFNYHFLM